MNSVNEMLGVVLTDVRGMEPGSEEITFFTTTGAVFRLYHKQDCCESVEVDDVCGNPEDLVGMPLLVSEEVSSPTTPPGNEGDESYTWTFYKFATQKGHVTVRWYGTSNGYYSESVDFARIK